MYRLDTIYNRLSNILFFNFILRLFIESYINFFISAVLNVVSVGIPFTIFLARVGKPKRPALIRDLASVTSDSPRPPLCAVGPTLASLRPTSPRE